MLKENIATFIGSKAMYISIASVVGFAGISGTIIGVQHNRHQVPAESTQVILESSTEIKNETTIDCSSFNSASTIQAEPSGDRALLYIKEYDALTAEYQAKRAELKAIIDNPTKIITKSVVTSKAFRQILPKRQRLQGGAGNYLETEEEYAAYLKQYEQELAQWEAESIIYESQKIEQSISDSVADSIAASQREENEKEKQSILASIDSLDKQYKNDVAALKAKYGI